MGQWKKSDKTTQSYTKTIRIHLLKRKTIRMYFIYRICEGEKETDETENKQKKQESEVRRNVYFLLHIIICITHTHNKL